MQLADVLPVAIEATGKSFAEGELAFVALTSKVERPFVDRLSYRLHRTLDPTRYTVAREFPVGGARADIAVLEGPSLCAVLEAKAMSSADCTREDGRRREYPDLLQKDLQRYATSRAGLEIFCLLLATHPLVPPPSSLGHVVKYSRLLSGAFRLHASAAAIREAAHANLTSFIREEVLLATGSIDAGEAFGLPVELLWWLYGPFAVPDRLTILRSGAA